MTPVAISSEFSLVVVRTHRRSFHCALGVEIREGVPVSLFNGTEAPAAVKALLESSRDVTTNEKQGQRMTVVLASYDGKTTITLSCCSN